MAGDLENPNEAGYALTNNLGFINLACVVLVCICSEDDPTEVQIHLTTGKVMMTMNRARVQDLTRALVTYHSKR